MAKVGITIEVDEKGGVKSVKRLGQEIEKLKSPTQAATREVEKFGRTWKSNNEILATSIKTNKLLVTAIASGVALSIKNLSDLVDTYSLLDSQIKLVIDSQEDLIRVQSELLDVANQTRQSFEDTVTLYTRLDRATKQLGIPDSEVLEVTKTLNEAILVSGASSAEASAAIRQLSQGLASGALRGDELRSVLEQVPRVAQLIADGLGITVGQLREFGAAGELTTGRIVKAIQEQGNVVNKEFRQIRATTGQTVTVFTNNVKELATEVIGATGAQEAFNTALDATNTVLGEINKQIAETKEGTRDQNILLRSRVALQEEINRLEFEQLNFQSARQGAINETIQKQLQEAKSRLETFEEQNKAELAAIDARSNRERVAEEDFKRRRIADAEAAEAWFCAGRYLERGPLVRGGRGSGHVRPLARLAGGDEGQPHAHD